jgi:hypothetical protein
VQAKDPRLAVSQADKYIRAYLQVWADAADSWNTRVSSDYVGYSGLAQRIRTTDPAAVRESLNAIVGTPSQALEMMRHFAEVVSPECMLWHVEFGSMPKEKSQRTLTLLLEKVLPKLWLGQRQ